MKYSSLYFVSIPTIGGKTKLLPILVPIFEDVAQLYDLRRFTDVFGGGNKFIPHLYGIMEELIYNDLDNGLCNLMLCAKDIDYLQAVIDRAYELQFEIQTKLDFENAMKRREDTSTPITESAALTLVVILFSRAADRQTFLELNKFKGIKYKSLLKYLKLNEYMQEARITCTDYKNLLAEIKDQPDFLIYLDPPYYGTESYKNSVDPKEMAEHVVDAKAKVIISNFENEVYENILVARGWYKYSLGEITKSSAGKRGSTQHEMLWSNFEIPEYLLTSVLYIAAKNNKF